MRSEEDDGRIPAPSPSRQIAFHQLLVAARKIWLADALREAVTRVDPVARARQKDALPAFCRAMGEALAAVPRALRDDCQPQSAEVPVEREASHIA